MMEPERDEFGRIIPPKLPLLTALTAEAVIREAMERYHESMKQMHEPWGCCPCCRRIG